MRFFLIVSAFLVAMTAAALAEDERPQTPQPPVDVQKVIREAEKARWDQMQRINQANPEEFNRSRQAMTRQLQANEIVSAYNAGSLSEAQAQQQLYPLIQQDVIEELPGLESRIIQTQKKLNALQEARSNPDSLVKKRIDELLGKAKPEMEQPF